MPMKRCKAAFAPGRSSRAITTSCRAAPGVTIKKDKLEITGQMANVISGSGRRERAALPMGRINWLSSGVMPSGMKNRIICFSPIGGFTGGARRSS